jgi:hypothetical protein
MERLNIVDKNVYEHVSNTKGEGYASKAGICCLGTTTGQGSSPWFPSFIIYKREEEDDDMDMMCYTNISPTNKPMVITLDLVMT